jgi:hypothetical protein
MDQFKFRLRFTLSLWLPIFAMLLSAAIVLIPAVRVYLRWKAAIGSGDMVSLGGACSSHFHCRPGCAKGSEKPTLRSSRGYCASTTATVFGIAPVLWANRRELQFRVTSRCAVNPTNLGFATSRVRLFLGGECLLCRRGSSARIKQCRDERERRNGLTTRGAPAPRISF